MHKGDTLIEWYLSLHQLSFVSKLETILLFSYSPYNYEVLLVLRTLCYVTEHAP